jgi:SAM-dependent methyltransferase
MALNPFAKSTNPHLLVVGMVGTKMGERIVQIGCAHAGRLGAIAAKVGLSGRAVAIVPDEESAARARKGAAQAGMLIEVEVAPPTALPIDTGAFDVAVVDDTADLVGSLGEEDRARLVRELFRILRPGGRVVAIGAAPVTGLAGMFGRGRSTPSFAASGAFNAQLSGDGFRPVRTLAEREGLVFVEAAKPRADEGRGEHGFQDTPAAITVAKKPQ